MQIKYLRLFKGLNEERKIIYNIVLNTMESNARDVFFVYGYGGMGKIYFWQTIILKIHSEAKIVLTVASLGIASLLLLRG